ncbi:hypothetical protein OHB14_36570 [Streptomyces sp. NBC_01613]|uniref:hypothetical protein n=1 Tax=Streptomyces sp. NBC_01613 TaxID=2975896 RepID=UPI0038643388
MTALPARIVRRWHTWLTTAYDDGRWRYRAALAALYPVLLAYAIYLAIFDRADPEPDEDEDGGPWCRVPGRPALLPEQRSNVTVIELAGSYL